MLRNSSTYIYLTLFVGLLCYLTFIDKKNPGTKEKEDSLTRLFNIERDDVTGMELTNLHGSFVFQKNGNHWEIKSPVNTPADANVLNAILNQIVYAQPQRVIPMDTADKSTESTLKEWGLQPSAERVVIHTKDKNYELLVGRKMAINDSVYALASGRRNEPVKIIPNTIKVVLQKELSDFRSRNVFDFDIDKVTKVATQIANTGTTPAQEYEVEIKDGKWVMQKPLMARASESEVQLMLNKFLAARVVDFVTDDASNLSSYGLTSPTATLTVTTKPDEDLVLQIGSPVPSKPDQVYAQRLKSNSVFTLTRDTVDQLLKAIPNVRDRHVLPFDLAKATGLDFSFANKKVQLRLKDKLWSTVGDDAGRADLTKSAEVFSHFTDLQTTPVLTDSATDLKPFGLDKPQGKVVIQLAGSKPDAITLLIGKNVNKLLYVRNSTEPFIYTLPENAFDFMPASNLYFRDARVIDLKLKQVKSMTVTIGSGTPIVLTRSEGGTWTATNVKDRMVDSVKADTQASLICQLQAKTWLGPVLPAYGLAKPLLTIALQTENGKTTTLRIGAVLPSGGHAAQVEGTPAAFEISDGDYGILNASSIQLVPGNLPATNAAPANSAPVKPAKKK